MSVWSHYEGKAKMKHKGFFKAFKWSVVLTVLGWTIAVMWIAKYIVLPL